jgi:hypothetical protein
MSATVTVARRFNGPLDSGNGGYSAGLVAAYLRGAAEVNLRSPVPLDRPLDVQRCEDGSVRLLDRERLIAEGRSTDLDLDVPAPVSVADAHEAAAGYRGVSAGTFSTCFVCGRDRDDAFGVFAGKVQGRRVVASPWTPAPWTADDSGRVSPEFVWAVLDCPTYFAAYLDDDLAVSVLASITARLDGEVIAGAEHVVMAWPLGVDGRKRYAGAAVLSADGQVRACARALMIELRG